MSRLGRYEVQIEFSGTATATVEASCEREAIEIAEEDAELAAIDWEIENSSIVSVIREPKEIARDELTSLEDAIYMQTGKIPQSAYDMVLFWSGGRRW